MDIAIEIGMGDDWSNKIGDMPKMRYYSLFKSNIEPESHLLTNLTIYQCSLLTQLRL